MSRVMDWAGKTGDAWAEEYRRTDRSFSGLTDHLLARTRDFSFSRVLDIGCGAGELALAIGRGRGEAEVLGVDISERLVEVAAQRGERLTNVAFETGDAATWSPSGGFRPDLLISRHGVMFFGDPPAAFAHLADIAAPGAGMLFSCFRGPSENEIFTGIGSLLPESEAPADPNAPGPMAFADPDRTRAILAEGGWTDIEFEPFDFAMVVGSGADPVADATEYFLSIGPAASRIDTMGAAERRVFSERLTAYLTSKKVDNIVALRAGAWIVTARSA